MRGKIANMAPTTIPSGTQAPRRIARGVRPLHEHIGEASIAWAESVLVGNPDPELRDGIADMIEDSTSRMRIVPAMDRGPDGSVDLGSVRLEVYLTIGAGLPWMGLVTIPAAAVLLSTGQPLDPAEVVRESLYQHGIGIPDSPAGLEDLPPAGAA